MPRYIVATRRACRDSADTALAAVENQPGVEVISALDPHMVTIDASEDRAASLAEKLSDTHIVEPEIRRELS
jgi:hypothetical protein